MPIMQLTQTIHLFPISPTRNTRKRTKAQPSLPGMEMDVQEKPAVTNRQIAEVLSNIAEILELQTANPYRIQAYRNAARGILALDDPVATILARGEKLPIPGLGDRLRRRIAEVIETGDMTFYNALCLQSLPGGVRALLAVHFVGIQTAVRLYQELAIDSPEKLWEAAKQHRIRSLPGFGPRSEARLQEGARQFLGYQPEEPLGGAA